MPPPSTDPHPLCNNSKPPFHPPQFLNFSVLVLLAILLRHPEMIQSEAAEAGDADFALDSSEVPQALPTPLSKVEAPYAYRENPKLSYRKSGGFVEFHPEFYLATFQFQ